MKNIPVRHIAKQQFDLKTSGRFSIRNVGDLLGMGDLKHELHRHDFFFILAIKNGGGRHEIDFVQYEVSDNAIFFLRPGQVHQLELKAGSTGFLMEFDTSFYHPKEQVTVERLKRAAQKNLCKFEIVRFEKLLSTLTSIFNEFVAKEEGYLDVIKANLDVFFIEYIRQRRNLQSTSSEISTYTQDRFEELLGLFESNIGQLKKVADYAKLLNLSPYQLNSITKAAVGKTAADLLDEYILLEIKRYLLATANQVKDVAYHLGYEDVSYFIRFFKKHTGYTPEVFRQKFK